MTSHANQPYGYTNMPAVLLFWDTNVAVMTSCGNALLIAGTQAHNLLLNIILFIFI